VNIWFNIDTPIPGPSSLWRNPGWWRGIKKMRIKNLTPHTVNVVGENGTVVFTVEPSGIVARCQATTVVIGEVSVDGVTFPMTETKFGELQDMPDPEEDTIFIVSTLVAQAAKGRNDVVIPNEVVRDEAGRIVGCKSFGRV